MRKLEKQTRFLCCVYGAVTLALGAACAACAYVGWQVFGAPAFAAAAAIFAAAALPLVFFLWKFELDSALAASSPARRPRSKRRSPRPLGTCGTPNTPLPS